MQQAAGRRVGRPREGGPQREPVGRIDPRRAAQREATAVGRDRVVELLEGVAHVADRAGGRLIGGGIGEAEPQLDVVAGGGRGRGADEPVGHQDVDGLAARRIVETRQQRDPVHVLCPLELAGDLVAAHRAQAQVDPLAEEVLHLVAQQHARRRVHRQVARRRQLDDPAVDEDLPGVAEATPGREQGRDPLLPLDVRRRLVALGARRGAR